MDIPRGSFDVTPVLWIGGADEGFDPAVNLQLVNGCTRLEATIDHALDTSRYPFDRLQLGVQTTLPADRLVLESDDSGSGLSSDLFGPGWPVGRPALDTGEQDVGTTLAAVHNGATSGFSRLTVSVPIAQESGVLAVGGFAGFAAATIALVSFAIPEGNSPARLSTLNGGIFAATGSRYLVNDRLGVGSPSALSETASAAAFLVVAPAPTAAVGNERLRVAGRPSAAVMGERTTVVAALFLTVAAATWIIFVLILQ